LVFQPANNEKSGRRREKKGEKKEKKEGKREGGCWGFMQAMIIRSLWYCKDGPLLEPYGTVRTDHY
jgi:hypothetical protein